MGAFKNHNFSLVRFVKQLGQEAGATLGIDPPGFANLDAHAQMSELPSTDILGMMGFALHHSGKLLTIHLGLFVSTVDDPDLVRHVEIMDIVAERLAPEKQVPVYDVAAPDGTPPFSWLIVADDGTIDPTGRENTRSIQVMTVRLFSGQTAGGQAAGR